MQALSDYVIKFEIHDLHYFISYVLTVQYVQIIQADNDVSLVIVNFTSSMRSRTEANIDSSSIPFNNCIISVH